MSESIPPNPDSFLPPAVAGDPPPPPPPSPSLLPPPPPPSLLTPPPRRGFLQLPRRLGIRLTTEFDSDSSVFFNKISYKFFDSLAKLRLSFQRNDKGEITEPQLALTSKYLSLFYDLEGHNALINSSFDSIPGLQFRAEHDVQAQQGEVAVVAGRPDVPFKLELSSSVPSIGLPKATFMFPMGEVSLQEKEEEEVKRMLSISGLVKAELWNGGVTAQYNDESLNLRYSYKDEQMTFIPSISLPSNELLFAFKRRFGPSDKLSYWYNFDSNDWSTAYKHTVGKDFKFKVGYDSAVRLGWASLWVGDENGKAKTAPMKTKVQFMLQVPQDDIKSAALMFRVKKRWDI